MRIALLISLLAVVTGLPVAELQVVAKPAMFYVLHDPTKDQWCAYQDQKRWRTAIDEHGALETASVQLIELHPTVVKITDADDPESGDWIVYDTYNLDAHGTVVSLDRVTNVLSDDVSRREMFGTRDGKLFRKSVATKSLKSGRPMIAKDAWFPKVPLFGATSDFPFGEFLNRPQQVLGRDDICLASHTSTKSAPE